MNNKAPKRSTQQNDIFLLVGQTLSQVSDRMVQLGLIWFITSSFGEQFLIWYLVAGGLPHALLIKYSSLMISRLSALKTVLYSDLARGFIYFFAFVLVLLFPEWLHSSGGKNVLWLLFISVFLSNIFSAFFNPAILSLAVEIKESDDVQKLTAKLSTVTSFATILGPVLGLFAFNQFGLSGLFLIAGLSYIASAYSVSLVSKTSSAARVPFHGGSSAAAIGLFHTKKIVGVMLAVFLVMNLLLSPLQVLMPTMAKDLFGNSFNSLAALETLLGAGILLGGAILSFYTIQSRTLFWTWVFLMILSLGFLLFTFSTSFMACAVALFLMGFALGLANVLIINILQTQPKAEDVPKVMSLVNLISTATLPFSLALLGMLQQTVAIAAVGRVAGIVLTAFVLISYFSFRRFGQEIFK
jgi:predicted MFS family arabinose efflux permease